jgi:hypothetical protein
MEDVLGTKNGDDDTIVNNKLLESNFADLRKKVFIKERVLIKPKNKVFKNN